MRLSLVGRGFPDAPLLAAKRMCNVKYLTTNIINILTNIMGLCYDTANGKAERKAREVFV